MSQIEHSYLSFNVDPMRRNQPLQDQVDLNVSLLGSCSAYIARFYLVVIMHEGTDHESNGRENLEKPGYVDVRTSKGSYKNENVNAKS